MTERIPTPLMDRHAQRVEAHLADPAHNPTLAATALHGAEQIWRANGTPNAPTPTVALRPNLQVVA